MLNYSFIVFLTALEMAHGDTPRWRADSANRLECTKKRISLQDTRPPVHLRVLATNALPHCAHDTKLHRVYKIHNKLAGYGQQETTMLSSPSLPYHFLPLLISPSIESHKISLLYLVNFFS